MQGELINLRNPLIKTKLLNSQFDENQAYFIFRSFDLYSIENKKNKELILFPYN